MSQELPLSSVINNTLEALKNSEDYSDRPTIANIMILINSVIDSPKELVRLSNQELANLSICMSCIMTSDFTKNYPKYYDWSTGKVVSAVGFYSYMKQLDNSYLLNSHYPSFIVLVHDGRKFISELLLDTVLEKENRILFFNDEYGQKQEAQDITKYFESMLHRTCQDAGFADEYTQGWFAEINSEFDELCHRIRNRDILEDAKSLYYTLAFSFGDGIMPNYCKVEER